MAEPSRNRLKKWNHPTSSNTVQPKGLIPLNHSHVAQIPSHVA